MNDLEDFWNILSVRRHPIQGNSTGGTGFCQWNFLPAYALFSGRKDLYLCFAEVIDWIIDCRGEKKNSEYLSDPEGLAEELRYPDSVPGDHFQ